MMDKPYRSARNIVRWTVGLLIATMATNALYTIQELVIGLYYPDYYDMSTPLAPHEDLVGIAGIVIGALSILCLIPTIVMYCVWAFRASKNAQALGARDMRFSAGWTVGYFFIPILNLFRPYQAIKEIEQASSPDHGSMDWKRAIPSGRVGQWWTLWIISMVIDQVATQMGKSSDPQVLHDSSWAGVLSGAFGIIWAYMFIRVILHIHRQQEIKVRVQPDAMQRTCLDCGYDIRGTPGLNCPECGAPIPGRDAYNPDITAPDPDETWYDRSY